MPLNNVFEFLYRNIAEPIKYDTGYNFVNTVMIAVLFVGTAWLLWEKIFRNEKIAIDSKFLLSLSIWLFFGSSSRVLEDSGIVSSPLFITPLIYGWIGALGVCTLLVSLKIEKKNPNLVYWKTWGFLGLILSLFNLSLLEFRKLEIFAIILPIMLVWYGILWFGGTQLFKHLPYNIYRNSLNKLALTAQLFDGTSSFIGITFFDFWEKHILGRFLLEFLESKGWLLVNSSGSWIIILLKIIVITVVLFSIDKYGESEYEKKFLKMLIFGLGLMLGLRNSMEIAAIG